MQVGLGEVPDIAGIREETDIGKLQCAHHKSLRPKCFLIVLLSPYCVHRHQEKERYGQYGGCKKNRRFSHINRGP
jgi:hypothetical protein